MKSLSQSHPSPMPCSNHKSLKALACLLVCNTLLSSVPFALADDLPATPPAPAAPRKVTFPEPREQKLDNGLRVIVAERPELPLISAKLLVEGGAEVDPRGMSGLAHVTASLLTKGTETRSAPEIAVAIEQLGATLESGAEWDDSYLALTMLSTQAEPAFRILDDVIEHPTFKDEELDRLRKQLQDEVQVEMGDPANLARYAAAKVIFGNGPYGHPVKGLPASLEKITRDDVLHLYQAHYQPQHAILVISGNITADHGFELAQKVFGGWKAGTASSAEAAATPETPAPAKSRTVIINMPTAGQAAVLMGKPGITFVSKDYFAGEVANAVLGLGYSSRLNEEIRIKRGLSYGAFSRLDARREPGPFIASAQTMNEAAGTVVSLMKQGVDGLSKGLVGDDELRTRKAALMGVFARGLETNEGFAREIGKLALYGIPPGSLNERIAQWETVNADQIKSFAADHLQADQMSAIVVGNTSRFQKAMTDQFKGAEVVDVSALDLGAESLQKAVEKK